MDKKELQERFDRVDLPFVKDRDESDDAWYACLQYLLLGEERNLLRAFRLFYNRPDARNATNSFRNWCSKFNWTSRASQYDLARSEHEKSLVKRAIAKVSKGTRYDYSEVFEVLRQLVVEDLQVDKALQGMLNYQIEEALDSGEKIKTNRLRDLVLIRKELLNGRKLAIEQASAIYGFGIISGTEGIVEEENVVEASIVDD